MRVDTDCLKRRIEATRRLAGRSPFPDEAETARSLLAILEERLAELQEPATTKTETRAHEPQNYYTPDQFVERERSYDRWGYYWSFGSWGNRWEDRVHTAHSGDPINRDFSAWIGRRSAQDTDFRTFWNEMSKEERKLWKETHWRPPAQLPGKAAVKVYKNGKWWTTEALEAAEESSRRLEELLRTRGGLL